MSLKDEKFFKKMAFDISKVKFQSGLKLKTNFFCVTNGSVRAQPKQSVQKILQILNHLTKTETLTPELVGDQSEMVE